MTEGVTMIYGTFSPASTIFKVLTTFSPIRMDQRIPWSMSGFKS